EDFRQDIYRSTNSKETGFGDKISSTDGEHATCIDTNVVPGIVYHYRIFRRVTDAHHGVWLTFTNGWKEGWAGASVLSMKLCSSRVFRGCFSRGVRSVIYLSDLIE